MKSLGSRLYAVIVAALLQGVSASDYDFEGLHSCFPSDYMRVAAPCDRKYHLNVCRFVFQGRGHSADWCVAQYVALCACKTIYPLQP